jgi:hypothetical protein
MILFGSGLGIRRRKSVESVAPFSTAPTGEHLHFTMEDMLLFRDFFLEIATLFPRMNAPKSADDGSEPLDREPMSSDLNVRNVRGSNTGGNAQG